MSTAERNFATFEFGDDPYQLADGLLTELADRVNVVLSKPNGPSDLVARFGKKETLRENNLEAITDVMSLEEAADYVERSGIMEPLNRSLWTPDLVGGTDLPLFVTGAVANWQDRTANVITLLPGQSDVHTAVGNRKMGSTDTERSNESFQKYVATFEEEPTEAIYFERFIKERLEDAGRQVVFQGYKNAKGDEIAQKYIQSEKGAVLLDGVMVARVANAGLQLALQLRKEARVVRPDFDSKEHPDLFIVTDGVSEFFKVARTDEEARPENAHKFQHPVTALRQAVVTGKLLDEARQQERTR